MAEATGLRNNALPYPVYGVPYALAFPLLDGTGAPISPSSPDSEISKNGDTFNDCTNEATEIAAASGVCYLLLTGAELTTDVAVVQIKSTGAKTTIMTLAPRKLPVLRSGTVGANASDGTTLQLDSGASTIDDYYNGCLLVGTLDSVVEARIVGDYVGSTRVCTIAGPAFITVPDNNDTFVVYTPDGQAFTQSIADEVFGEAYESTETFREYLRLTRAALAGKADGLGTTTVHFRDIADAKNRITATVDADGNRTAVTPDAT